MSSFYFTFRNVVSLLNSISFVVFCIGEAQQVLLVLCSVALVLERFKALASYCTFFLKKGLLRYLYMDCCSSTSKSTEWLRELSRLHCDRSEWLNVYLSAPSRPTTPGSTAAAAYYSGWNECAASASASPAAQKSKEYSGSAWALRGGSAISFGVF